MKIIRKPQANIPHELKMPKNLNKIIANQIQQYKNKPTNPTPETNFISGKQSWSII